MAMKRTRVDLDDNMSTKRVCVDLDADMDVFPKQMCGDLDADMKLNDPVETVPNNPPLLDEFAVAVTHGNSLSIAMENLMNLHKDSNCDIQCQIKGNDTKMFLIMISKGTNSITYSECQVECILLDNSSKQMNESNIMDWPPAKFNPLPQMENVSVVFYLNSASTDHMFMNFEGRAILLFKDSKLNIYSGDSAHGFDILKLNTITNDQLINMKCPYGIYRFSVNVKDLRSFFNRVMKMSASLILMKLYRIGNEYGLELQTELAQGESDHAVIRQIRCPVSDDSETLVDGLKTTDVSNADFFNDKNVVAMQYFLKSTLNTLSKIKMQMITLRMQSDLPLCVQFNVGLIDVNYIIQNRVVEAMM